MPRRCLLLLLLLYCIIVAEGRLGAKGYQEVSRVDCNEGTAGAWRRRGLWKPEREEGPSAHVIDCLYGIAGSRKSTTERASGCFQALRGWPRLFRTRGFGGSPADWLRACSQSGASWDPSRNYP